jgi:uncharacterized protein (DUF169 family)
MMDEFIKNVEDIVEALGIEKEPVGVTYTDEDPGVAIEPESYTVCGAILKKLAKPPVGLSKKVFLYPVRKGLFLPDLVLLLVNSEQASRLITLNQFWDGKTPSMEMRGALCWSMITYPLVSGNFNLSVGDISARRLEQWDPAIMVASIPGERIRGIAEAVDVSTAGRAEPSEKFKRMTEQMRSRK